LAFGFGMKLWISVYEDSCPATAIPVWYRQNIEASFKNAKLSSHNTFIDLCYDFKYFTYNEVV